MPTAPTAPFLIRAANRKFRITKPRCPTCGATLLVRIIAISVAEPTTNLHTVHEIDVQCEGLTPPGDDADAWVTAHARNVDQHRAIKYRLLDWINKTYRFNATRK